MRARRREMPKNLDQYWASLDTTEFLEVVHCKIRDYYDDIRQNGLYYAIDKSYRYYYGGQEDRGVFSSVTLGKSGKYNEKSVLKLNHYRNVLQHILQLSTSDKPAYQCKAINSDYASQTQTVLANGLLDYYIRDKDLLMNTRNAAELALVATEGWVHVPWNIDGGEDAGQGPSGKAIKEGDIEIGVYSPLDVVRDIGNKGEKHNWLLLRRFKSKWDLIANRPELKDEILNNASSEESYQEYDSFEFSLNKRLDKNETDQICVWVFYHLPTPAMPKGRLVEFIGDCLLYDGAMPYKDIPLYKMSPDRIMNSPYSYTPGFDILPAQHGLDIISSILISNNIATGMQSLWLKTGSNLNVIAPADGLRLLHSNEMPQSLQLTKSAPETYNLQTFLIGSIETLSGMNSTIRGNPPAGIKSGNGMALLVSQSVQFASLIQESYSRLFEDVGGAILENLRTFSHSTRTARIVGKYNSSMLRTFEPEKDLSGVSRVEVDRGNPLTKTVAGRVEVANNLLQQGLITDPRQYLEVLYTGQLDSSIEDTQSRLLAVRSQKESLQAGKWVEPIITDDHAKCIAEALSLIDTPSGREDANLVGMVLKYVQAHLDQWSQMSPAMLQMTRQQPAPSQAMPPPPGAPGGQPPAGPGGPPPPNGGNGGPGLEAVQGGGGVPGMPSLPSLPPGSPPEAQAAYAQVSTPNAPAVN